MAGTKYGSFAVGDANIDNVMLNLAGINTGYCALTLTEMTTTNVPQIAAGSKIEVGGSLFKFDADETITGSATTGTNYIRLVPSGSSITAEWTTTAPTWSDSKQGWYDSTGVKRYWNGHIVKSGTYVKYTWVTPLAGNSGPRYDYNTDTMLIPKIIVAGTFKDENSNYFMGQDSDGNNQYRKKYTVTTNSSGVFTLTHGISSLVTSKRMRHFTIMVLSQVVFSPSGYAWNSVSDTTISISGLGASSQYQVCIDYSE